MRLDVKSKTFGQVEGTGEFLTASHHRSIEKQSKKMNQCHDLKDGINIMGTFRNECLPFCQHKEPEDT